MARREPVERNSSFSSTPDPFFCVARGQCDNFFRLVSLLWSSFAAAPCPQMSPFCSNAPKQKNKFQKNELQRRSVAARAEGGASPPPPPPAPVKKDRSNDQLIFASEQSLRYVKIYEAVLFSFRRAGEEEGGRANRALSLLDEAFSRLEDIPISNLTLSSQHQKKITTKNFTSVSPLPKKNSYLNGTLPADYGFDPLGLSDPEGAGAFVNPKWLAYSEVIHGRWAMLGAAGCIAPEVLASAGAIPQSPSEVLWFKSGVIPPAGTYERGYWADPFSLFWLEVVAMQFAELKRWQDYRHPGSQGKQYFLGMENAFGGSGDPAYPGGPWFNMFNLGKTEADMKVLKTKEVSG